MAETSKRIFKIILVQGMRGWNSSKKLNHILRPGRLNEIFVLPDTLSQGYSAATVPPGPEITYVLSPAECFALMTYVVASAVPIVRVTFSDIYSP